METVLTNGLVIGSVYGAVALGLVLVYKSSSVINFAHAETGMIGAFVFAALWTERKWPYLAAVAVGLGTSAAAGLATRLVLVRQENSPLNMLLGSLGVAGVLLFVALETWGPEAHYLPPVLNDLGVTIGDVRLAGSRLLILLATTVVGVALFAVFRFSTMGLTFRATAVDPLAAELVGVNVGRLRSATWAMAGLLSGGAAILVAPLVGFDVFFMDLLLVRALTAALLVRMLSLPGCVAAGLALGIAEATLARNTTAPGAPEAAIVVILLLVLLVRSGRTSAVGSAAT